MLRRIFLLVALLLAMPVLANAWTLTGTVLGPSGSGEISVNTNPVKVMTTGTGYAFVTNGSSAVVTIIPKTLNGVPYSVSLVKIDGVTQIPTPSGPITIPFDGSSHSISVTFAASTFTITVTQVPGGTVSIQQIAPTVSGTSYTSLAGIKPGATIKVFASPETDQNVTSITAGGVTTPFNDGAGSIKYITFIPTQSGTVTATYSMLPTYNVVLTAPGTSTTGTDVTADASSTTSNDTDLSYAFTVRDSGNVTMFSRAANSTPSFTFRPTVVGDYTITVAVTSLHNSTGVTRTVALHISSATAVANNVCTSCHSSNSLQVVTAYYASRHNDMISCQDCHTATPHGVPPTSSVCATCHVDSGGNVPGHPLEIGTNPCLTCHDPHSALAPPVVHFNSVTGAGYPASYITSRAKCTNCHYSSTANTTNRLQWAASGHSATKDTAWTSYDFKTEPGCVQCHTTTGFIAYSTGKVTAAWGVASDKTKEVLTCIGCHSDISTGALRTVTPVKPFADDAYVNRNVGKSNICFDCHSGTNNGNSIGVKVGFANFTSLPFISPHYLAAGANLHGKAGYHFPGQTYAFYSSNSHRMIGMGNNANTGSAGPCIACHRSAADKHLYKALTTDIDGTITGISVTVCVNCHADSLNVTQLNDDHAAFVNALNVLKAMLAAKGFIYTTNYPKFNNTNWGSDQAGANAMGAAYNYVLLLSDTGAYVHNSAYARKLIVDSIDCLYNGSVTGSIDSALASLVGTGAIAQQAADKLSAYKTSAASCTSCHDTASTGSHTKHQADGLSCGQCHNATALSGSTLVPGTAAHLNGQLDVLIAQANNKSGGMNFNKVGNSCSGVSCHGNGTQTVTWGNSTVTCESCHVGALSVIDGVTARDRSLSTTSGHGKPGIGNLCLDCHDSNKQHLGGAGMLKDPLTGMFNTECNYCHNDTSLIPNPAFNNMRAHIDKNGQVSACADCHDPHGTTNLYMIRTSILGQSITFTTEAELIDQTTNKGFCQVCHTKTKYFRAGVPETNHDSTGCLGCHDHKSENGGFMTKPGRECDSCHGYPPAPRLTALPVGFGTMNNWSSAIFERYSGGGGAHLVAAHVPKNAKPSDGWINCIMCHNPGDHREDLMPENPPVIISHIRVIVQPQYRFGNGFSGYTGAKLVDPPARNVTGSCFNLSCHMSPSPRWSTER